MATEDFLINNSSYWQAIEAVRKGLPQLYIVTAFALIIKP